MRLLTTAITALSAVFVLLAFPNLAQTQDVSCNTDGECQSPTPVCDLTTHICVGQACTADAECSGYAPDCDLAAGRCMCDCPGGTCLRNGECVELITNAAPLLADMPGPRKYGENCLYPNDDGSSKEIDLTPYFPKGLRFFSDVHRSMYVNTNGNITFSGSLRTYTPNSFPVADQPMIAPYWADIDIRVVSESCRSGSVSDDCHLPADNGLWWDLQPGRIVVTWDRVNYFSCQDDKRMTFQLIISQPESCAGEGDFDVEFRFNRCEWTTGNASGGTEGFGGTPGQSGFDAGDQTNFVMLPGSRMPGIHKTLCTQSNVDDPGVWRFQVRSGNILCEDAGEECNTGLNGVCAVGRTQCDGGGVRCEAVVSAGEELCDALDNDCDGKSDEGSLCGAGQTCERGRCIDVCFEGGCPTGQTCSEGGACVDNDCLEVDCPVGQRCVEGQCFDACADVICPYGRVCRGGRCVDECEGVECDAECTVCETGLCVAKCNIGGSCPIDRVCDEASGACVPAPCVGVTCAEGDVCTPRGCVDPCADANCPEGEVCIQGGCKVQSNTPCVLDEECDDGEGCLIEEGRAEGRCVFTEFIADDTNADAGASDEDAGADSGVDAGAGDAGGRSDDGCSCRTPQQASTTWSALAFLLGLSLLRRRRRRS